MTAVPCAVPSPPPGGCGGIICTQKSHGVFIEAFCATWRNSPTSLPPLTEIRQGLYQITHGTWKKLLLASAVILTLVLTLFFPPN